MSKGSIGSNDCHFLPTGPVGIPITSGNWSVEWTDQWKWQQTSQTEPTNSVPGSVPVLAERPEPSALGSNESPLGRCFWHLQWEQALVQASVELDQWIKLWIEFCLRTWMRWTWGQFGSGTKIFVIEIEWYLYQRVADRKYNQNVLEMERIGQVNLGKYAPQSGKGKAEILLDEFSKVNWSIAASLKLDIPMDSWLK